MIDISSQIARRLARARARKYNACLERAPPPPARARGRAWETRTASAYRGKARRESLTAARCAPLHLEL